MSSDSDFDFDGQFNQDDLRDRRNYKSGHQFRTEWAGKIERFVDRIANWPRENWLIFGAGLIIGAIVA